LRNRCSGCVYAKYFEVELAWEAWNGQLRRMGRNIVDHNEELARHVEVMIIEHRDGTLGKRGKLFIRMTDTYYRDHFATPEQGGPAKRWRDCQES